jgi:hypothetical protein
MFRKRDDGQHSCSQNLGECIALSAPHSNTVPVQATNPRVRASKGVTRVCGTAWPIAGDLYSAYAMPNLIHTFVLMSDLLAQPAPHGAKNHWKCRLTI